MATAIAMFAVSGYLDFTPAALIKAEASGVRRFDALFECDAGYNLDEIISGRMEVGRGVHPILHLIWRVPLHHLTRWLAPLVTPEVTAIYSARLYDALFVGLGTGLLAAALVRRGVRPAKLAAFAPIWLLATGHVITAVPDHFGLSLGILAAAFAFFLDGLDGPARPAITRLLFMAAFAGGVTITNVLFPLWLLGLLILARFRDQIRRRHLILLAVLAAISTLIVVGFLATSPERLDRFRYRVNAYINWRLVEQPAIAGAYAIRGVIDPIIGPSPRFVPRNYQNVPMVTYEPVDAPYQLVPYNRWQLPSVLAWLTLLTIAAVRLTRQRDDRWPVLALVGWIAFNLLFHNIWGDEFFLYNPHYSWALAAAVLLGLRGLPWRGLALTALLLAIGQCHTLAAIRAALNNIAG